MYLKALELTGFKSFAQGTKIDFHRGVTAIVGPNGCGKSNVLDAIRWVLGEQSAKALRGSLMQDVIFSGTDSRPALGMAEVSMTFTECEDHLGTDFHEVCVTRRVFRDGQSEYEMNKSTCRLKDIHRLFMDTGIGRSAYSIMEQGKIDLILSSKPEDRRAVFEEAAGITRFKAQKKEALRKLEATEGNLMRVTDIIREVGRQIGSLQRQAAKARRYREIFDELKTLDTQLASHQYRELKESLDARTAQTGALRAEFEELQRAAEEKETRVRNYRMEMENLESTLRSMEQQKQGAENAAEQARQQIAFNRQRIDEMEQLAARNRQEIASAEEKLRVVEEQAQTIRGEFETLELNLKQMSGKLQEASGVLEAQRASAAARLRERAALDADIARIDDATTRMKGQLDALGIRQRTCSVRIEKIDEEERLVKNALQRLASRIADLDAAIEEKRSRLEQLKGQSPGDEKRESLSAFIASARDALDNARGEFASAEGEIRMLRQVLESRVGFSDATKKILQAFGERGAQGTVLEHLRVKTGYEKAIQNFLGRLGDAVVLNSDALADEIGVRHEDFGQMMLAPKRERWADSPETDDPFRGAIRFVEIDPQVEGLLDGLLDDLLIAEDLDEALELRKTYPNKHVATREGEVFFIEGWQLRGRAMGASGSILEQRNRMEALEKLIPKLVQARDRALADVKRHEDALAKHDARQKENAIQHQAIEGELSAVEYERRELVRQKNEAEKRMETLSHERIRLAEQDSSEQSEARRLEKECAEQEILRRDKLKTLEGSADQLRILNEDVEARSHEVTALRIEEAAVRQRLDAMGTQNAGINTRRAELTEAIQSRRREIAEYSGRKTESEETICHLDGMILSHQETFGDLTGKLVGESERKGQLHQMIEAMEQDLRIQRKKANEVQAACGKEDVELTRQRMHLNALIERIQHAYQIDLSAWEPPQDKLVALTDPTAAEVEPATQQEQPADWAGIEARVAELREKTERMGPVNVEAIAEYEELEQRLDFLKRQETDLIDSRDQLHAAIKKINQTTKVMFAETFEKIQKNFQEMFEELFGGGKAQLNLADESDPLECGIDIIARPPGKQLQSISLLSGGERAMTAVALLFSIYMVKPSPFCFLDEMDAPLDESNITRFIRILQRFVKQSQFVVITHNRRTISSADVLYGVTMEEHGISKIVSLRLARSEESPLFSSDGEIPTVADSVRKGPLIRNPVNAQT